MLKLNKVKYAVIFGECDDEGKVDWNERFESVLFDDEEEANDFAMEVTGEFLNNGTKVFAMITKPVVVNVTDCPTSEVTED